MNIEIKNTIGCNFCDGKGYWFLDMHGAVSLLRDLYTGKEMECLYCNGTGQIKNLQDA